MPLAKEQTHTIEDIYALTDGERAELIDGQIYYMAPPSFLHQKISVKLSSKIDNYITEHKGRCQVLAAPFAVFLNEDDRNYVEPDISVICDTNKINERGCNGAPDWVIEIVSPSSKRMDYYTKLFKYCSAGVREYWIVDPAKNSIMAYSFVGEENGSLYSFNEDVPVTIYPGFSINLEELLK